MVCSTNEFLADSQKDAVDISLRKMQLTPLSFFLSHDYQGGLCNKCMCEFY